MQRPCNKELSGTLSASTFTLINAAVLLVLPRSNSITLNVRWISVGLLNICSLDWMATLTCMLQNQCKQLTCSPGITSSKGRGNISAEKLDVALFTGFIIVQTSPSFLTKQKRLDLTLSPFPHQKPVLSFRSYWASRNFNSLKGSDIQSCIHARVRGCSLYISSSVTFHVVLQNERESVSANNYELSSYHHTVGKYWLQKMQHSGLSSGGGNLQDSYH